MDELMIFGYSFILNGLIALIIVRLIYFPVKRDKEYVLTFLAFNTLIFLITSLLSDVDLTVGFGFSLFAIFSILRYRTDPIPIREMTYLFVMMALPVVNAVLIAEANYSALTIANGAVLLVLYLVEKEWGFHYVSRKMITYERIDLIKPENYQTLLTDLRERTGLEITRCEINKIDFLRDVADILIYYKEPDDEVVIIRSGTESSAISSLLSQDWQVAAEDKINQRRLLE